ncbi:MAG TPA: hypothetical protein PKC40_02950 [Saprospiraceae bacterium]|nr:hypothetical protein [Saprospiraceae bacterium]
MRHYLICIFLFTCSIGVFGQQKSNMQKGQVTYQSSKNVYIKFESTEEIEIGDTVFIKKENSFIPCLTVNNKSSTSCVCSTFCSEKINIKDEVYVPLKIKKKQEKEEVKEDKKEAEGIVNDEKMAEEEPQKEVEQQTKKNTKQKIKGRISAASYSNFIGSRETHRMRYAFSMQANNLGGSKFSTENYILFRHTLGEWADVKNNLNDFLKVFSLSVRYDADPSLSFILGRRINQRISSLGALDGLQVEKNFENFSIGILAGSKPDLRDFSLNTDLLEGGAYVGFSSRNKNLYQQSTLGLIEQRNKAEVDRRFVYFQHSSSPAKNMNIYSSFEVDLFQKVNDEAQSDFRLTNFYISARYRFSKKLSFSAAYDTRKNIIYFESYKSFIDRLLEDETRQGLRVNANYNFLKNATLGVNANWRFQKNNTNLSKNLNAYINFSRVPVIKAAVSLTANFLQTAYLDSKYFGIRLTREILKGKLTGDLYFRYTDYAYKNLENTFSQKIAGIDFSYNLTQKLAFYIYYEGSFQQDQATFSRLNTKLIQRF